MAEASDHECQVFLSSYWIGDECKLKFWRYALQFSLDDD